ncbi:metalloproteinase inhibitor 1-like [Bolinopsis microptera]|uniref:metalloproteinase inhibitor 1-like n=1 Tax=Bolinopsis microptera TaxID=2820187 RepID=UPI0030793DE8
MFCLVLLVHFASLLAASTIIDTSQIGDTAPQFGRIPRQPGCFCLRSSLHNHMCRDDFVIKAKILDDSMGRGHRRALHGYQILVKEIFHLPDGDNLKAGDRVALYTPANEDFCGTSFVRRNTYLLSGRIVDTILVVTSCDYSRKWSTITTSIQRTLNALPNKRHCSCKVFGCNGEVCGGVESGEAFSVFETSRCFTKRDTLQERCYEDYGECRMSNRGTCSWRSQRKPKVCMNVARRRMRNT